MKKALMVLLFCALVVTTVAQENRKLSKEQIMSMSIEELSDLPLEELMQAVETLGVTSVDELFALIMNKNVSSASKKDEDAFKVPLSSTAITYDEIRSYGATTLEEALKLVPGVIVQQKANGSFDIHIRGLNNIPDNQILLYAENSNALMLLDGRPCHNYGIGGANLEFLPISIEDVERIEVIRGANSALYGQNAVQGFINIVTKKPDSSENMVSGSFQVGNQATIVGDLALRKAFNDKIALGISYNMQNRDRETDLIYALPGEYGLPDENGQYVKYIDANGDGTPDTPELTNPMREGKWMTVEELDKAMQLNTLTGAIAHVWDQDFDFKNRFKDPNLARHNWGVNGYVTLTPNTDARVDITAGYGEQHVASQTLTEQFHSMSYRKYRGGYINLVARYKDLHISASYDRGPQNYLEGMPEFNSYNYQAFATADYDFKITDFLSVRPGLSWQWIKYSDRAEPREDGGILNDEGVFRKYAPSLRADFNMNGFRTLLAVRSDKTNAPDKWNTSIQAALSYDVNKSNFVRLVYSHAMRSAVMLFANSTYSRARETLPYRIRFEGNRDVDLMNLDSYELGYRTRPTSKLQIDFEAFYSKSKDYGALMSKETSVVIPIELFQAAIQDYSTLTNPMAMLQYVDCMSTIRYENLPYKVSQIGASVAIDYIISKSFVARLNLNYQKTKIDNYYIYNQAKAIEEQITGAEGGALVRAIGIAKAALTAMSSGKVEDCNNLIWDGVKSGMLYQVNDANGAPVAYGVRSSQFTIDKYEDGVENKATPNIYGSLGLIYKPLTNLQISSVLNYLGERTYVTNFSAEKLNPHFTVDLKVGYYPHESFEIFFNARNLFDNDKREFYGMDTIGGIYTMGLTFGF